MWTDRATLNRAFGECVRRLRKHRGIPQERMALECEIDRAYFGQLERGHHSPTLETISRILYVLKISFADFGAELDKSVRREKHGRRKNNERATPD